MYYTQTQGNEPTTLGAERRINAHRAIGPFKIIIVGNTILLSYKLPFSLFTCITNFLQRSVIYEDVSFFSSHGDFP